MSITPAKPPNMPLSQAIGPEAMPLRRWVREDPVGAERWMANQFNVCNALCGGHAEANEVTLWAEMVLGSWPYSCEGLVQALSDGIRSGKIYGKLTYPVIAEWLKAYEAKISGVSETEAAQHKYRDNGGTDWLDRMEAGSDASRLRAANERVRALEQKLRNNG